jgi:hypothetical protein
VHTPNTTIDRFDDIKSNLSNLLPMTVFIGSQDSIIRKINEDFIFIQQQQQQKLFILAIWDLSGVGQRMINKND